MEDYSRLNAISLSFLAQDALSIVLFYLNGDHIIGLWCTGNRGLQLKLGKLVKSISFFNHPLSLHLPLILNYLPSLQAVSISYNRDLAVQPQSTFSWSHIPSILTDLRIIDLKLSKWTLPSGGMATWLPHLEVFHFRGNNSSHAYQLVPFPDTLTDLQLHFDSGSDGSSTPSDMLEFLPPCLKVLDFSSDLTIDPDFELHLPETLTFLRVENLVGNLNFLRHIHTAPLEHLELKTSCDDYSGTVYDPTEIDFWSLLPPSLTYLHIYTDTQAMMEVFQVSKLPKGLRYIYVMGNGGRTNSIASEFWSFLPQLEWMQVGNVLTDVSDENVSLLPKTYRQVTLAAKATNFTIDHLPSSVRRLAMYDLHMPQTIMTWPSSLTEITIQPKPMASTSMPIILPQLPESLLALQLQGVDAMMDPNSYLPSRLHTLQAPAGGFYEWIKFRIPDCVQCTSLSPEQAQIGKRLFPPSLTRMDLYHGILDGAPRTPPIWMIPFSAKLLPLSLKSLQIYVIYHCKLSQVSAWFSNFAALHRLASLSIFAPPLDVWSFQIENASNAVEYDYSCPIPTNLPDSLQELMLTGDTNGSGFSLVPPRLTRLTLARNSAPVTEDHITVLPKSITTMEPGPTTTLQFGQVKALLPNLLQSFFWHRR